MNKPRILICPLDWGLGHAVRCVPIIRTLKRMGAVPVIAADHGPLELLKKEFPDAEFVQFPGVSISYPADGGNMLWSMLKQTPALLQGIKDEKAFIKKIVPKLHIDAVISDNRFGAYSNIVPSVYITHQIHIQTGNIITDALARKQHAQYMKKFQSVWIPDIEEEYGISGKLAHGKHIPLHAAYIGFLSRFSATKPSEKKYDISFILSGPEPQRTILENIILNQTSLFPDKRFLFIRGKNELLDNLPNNITCIPLADSQAIEDAYSASEHIVCRSGYSSIMEMVSSGRSAWLIPTPGQTEQEYLSAYLQGKFGFTSILQNEIRLDKIFHQTAIQKQTISGQSSKKLEDLIKKLFVSIEKNGNP